MADDRKTEAELREELEEMRRQVAELEQSEAKRQEAEEALRESELRYSLVTSSTDEGLWDWNLETNKITFSDRWKSILGCGEQDIGDRPEEWLDRVHEEDVERLKREISAHREGYTPHLKSEHRMAHKDGTVRWMFAQGIAVRDDSGAATRIVGTLVDITEGKIAEERLRRGAFYDSLTALPNRAVFMDRLGRAMERAKRHGGRMFAVLFMDLDRFKIVNDSLGHVIGDELLSAVAKRAETCLRTSDTIARLGGDEFVLLLDGLRDPSDAMRVSERIQKALRTVFNLDGQEVFISASIGIALGTPRYERPEELLRDADIAMYRAKSLGRARHEIFDEGMHTQAVTRLKLENDLHRAIERREFRVHYQPIIALKDGKIFGFEALVRWWRPDIGLVSPAEFIPVAEETGMITAIDRWVLREACHHMHGWHTRFPKTPPLFISVNLSRKQLAEPDLVDQIQQTLRDTGLDPDTLRPEITESHIMEDMDAALAVLDKLRELHILMHMDDFGTGYSSLSHLVRFQVDTLKIDGSFVANMEVHGENFEIVRMIVTLGHNLGMRVIAEGVETKQQLSQLRKLRCDYAQGYLFAKPMDTESTEDLIASDPTW